MLIHLQMQKKKQKNEYCFHQNFKQIIIKFMQIENYQKLNTFSRRICFNQVITYVFIILVNISFWLFIQNYFINQNYRFALIVLFSMSQMTLISVGFITSYLDPSDPLMRELRSNNSTNIKRNLQNCLFCQYCHSYVLVTSRHCKTCDRCIHQFDHHCMWINNCVGGINYKTFFVMIIVAFVHLSIYLISIVLLWNQNTHYQFLPQMITDWIVGGITIIFLLLILGLIILHFYLISHNMTTFEYILSKKTSDERRKYNNILKVKCVKQPNQHQSTPNKSNQPYESQQMFKTQHQMRNTQVKDNTFIKEEQKSDLPSIECFKQTNKMQKQSVDIKPQQKFEDIVYQEPEYEEKNPKEFYRRHKSLKLLVGSSIDIKQRKENIYEFTPKNKRRSRKTQHQQPQVSIYKIDDLVYYVKQQESRQRTSKK